MDISYVIRVKNLFVSDGPFEKQQKQYYFDLLKNIQEKLGHFTVCRKGIEIDISVDWSKAIDDYDNNLKNNFFMDQAHILYELEKNKYKSISEFLNKHDIPSSTEIFFTLSIKESDGNTLMPYEIEQTFCNFLYHLFLILNLSCPGFLDLYSAELNTEFSTKYNISNHYFKDCWYSNDWPSITYIPVHIVKEWYDKLGLWDTIKSKSRLEKCIFSLLHFCEEEKISPSKIVWLAHAIESIFEIPQSSILQTMKERILIVLSNENDVNHKIILKKLNEFYQYRSNFVHGNLDIFIPSESIIDVEGNEDYLGKLFETEEFAFKILTATLQRMILAGWSTFNFKTIVTGE